MQEEQNVEEAPEVDFDALYNQYANESEPAEAVEQEEATVPVPPAQEEEVPEEAEAPKEPEPFQFDEKLSYPVPGRDGIDYVPFKKFKRWIEQGRGAARLIERMKTREKELSNPIAINESLSDIPDDLRQDLYERVKKTVDQFRQEISLPRKFNSGQNLQNEDRSLLEATRAEIQQLRSERSKEKILTTMRENVIMVDNFAKEELGVEIDEKLGSQLRAAANEEARRLDIPLHKVNLVGVLTRLVPSHIKANIRNQMELDGKKAPSSKPVVGPKASPGPRATSAGKRKLSELSQSELEALGAEGREALLNEHLMGVLGK